MVIGAGIIGVCVAAYLQRDGRDVTLIDHGEPGSGASSGNGGILSGSSIIPVGMPGIAAKVPGWLNDPEGPFTLRWSYLPKIAPWLIRLLQSATPAKVEAQAIALRGLLKSSLENYAPLVQDAGATHLVHQHGQLYLYASERSFRNDMRNTDIRRRNGVAIEDVIGSALREIEPDLGTSFTHARVVRANGHISDPRALVQAFAAHAVARGATLHQERVMGFEHNGARVNAVVTGNERHSASGVVVACGAWSKPLAEKLGDRVPLDTERGYNIVVKDPEKGPRLPTLYVDGNFGATPMDMGLRLVGTVELAGLDAPPNWQRADMLLKKGRALYPGLAPVDDASRITRWLGFRPSMPDSLPVIGTSSRFANAYYAFGHGHVGMCAGSTTGRVIADLIAGRTPCVPIEPFGPRRF